MKLYAGTTEQFRADTSRRLVAMLTVKARERGQHLYLWLGPEVSLADAHLGRSKKSG